MIFPEYHCDMSNQHEKNLFSERLKKALTNAQQPISPTQLANEFNYRYDGTPISVQSANNWLQSKAIPNQDKLSILAIWLNVSSQWLRFGDVAEATLLHDLHDQAERDYLLKYRQLPAKQKMLIHSLIDELL